MGMAAELLDPDVAGGTSTGSYRIAVGDVVRGLLHDAADKADKLQHCHSPWQQTYSNTVVKKTCPAHLRSTCTFVILTWLVRN